MCCNLYCFMPFNCFVAMSNLHCSFKEVVYVFYLSIHCGIPWTGLDVFEGQCLS